MRSRRVGVSTFFRLLKEHGTAKAALEVLPEVARAAGVEGYQICPLPVVEQELRAARLAGAVPLAFGAPAYPAALAEIPDPPPLLWAIGDTALLARPKIAIVGARNASSLGLRMARRLAGELGKQGQVIVSGLARGIDTAAHDATLETGTIAVLASGVDVIYPHENTVLGEEIGRSGLRLSEAPMGAVPQARHFPARNRIVSGLSRAVVVVEAAARSGSLITAKTALDQGREVFAVPGHPFDARASGCNMLIRDGATLVRGAGDVIEALEAQPEATAEARHAAPSEQAAPARTVLKTAAKVPAKKKPAEKKSAAEKAAPPANDRYRVPTRPEYRKHEETLALHDRILDRLGAAPLAEDQLIRDLARPAAEITPELTALELEGRIERRPGGLVNRID
ncbi:MAG: DNA-processing protein DprA [Maritimibacter sp.]|nr:DNA-processing protein DprA [Maritimibacter sp.]